MNGRGDPLVLKPQAKAPGPSHLPELSSGVEPSDSSLYSSLHASAYAPRSPQGALPPLPRTQPRRKPPHTLKNSLVEAYIILVRVLAVSGAL